MKKGFKAVTAAALAVSALTPVAAFAAESTVDNGVYTTSNYYSIDAFKKLSGSAKAAALTSEGAVIVIAGKVYTGNNVITLSDSQLGASAVTVDAYNAANGNKLVSGKPIGGENQTGDLKVESVSAINAKQLVINFSKPVKKADVVAAATSGGEVKDTLVNGKITVTSLDSASVTINSAKAKLSDDGKTLTLTADSSEVFKGRYDVKIAAGAIKTTDNKEIAKYETTIKAEDTAAPTIKSVEKVTSTKFKVTFSEPMKTLGTVTFKVGDKDIQSGSTGVTTSFTAGNDYAEFTVSTDVEAGQELVTKFVGASDYADQVTATNPVTASFVKGSKDGVAPTVASVTVVSGKTLEVKFSEELAAVPTITIGGTAATVKQDKTDKTKYTATLTTAKTGLQTVVVASGFADLSGESQGTQYSKAVNFSVDTTAPKLVSTTVETGSDAKEYLVLTFDENVEKGSVTSIGVTGKKTKNYVTSNLSSVTISDTTKLLFDEDNKKVVKILVSDILGATNDEKGATFDVTVTAASSASLVQDESGNAGVGEVKASFTRGEDGAAPTAAQATIDKTSGSNGIAIVDNNTLTVTFEQAVDGATATTASNYVIEGATVEKAELGSNEKVVTLKLKAGSVQDTGAHKVTISNVKAKNGTAMDVYTTSESLNENVLPTLVSADVTAVAGAASAITATSAGFFKADGTAYTPVAGDAIGTTAKYYGAGATLENGGTASSAGWYKLSDDSAYTPASGNEIGSTGTKYYASGATIVPAVTASTTIVLTFSENVKTASGADATYTVKSGTTSIGTGTITNDTTADTKTLTVNVNGSATASQLTTGLTLIKLAGDVTDAVGNKFDVPVDGFLAK